MRMIVSQVSYISLSMGFTVDNWSRLAPDSSATSSSCCIWMYTNGSPPALNASSYRACASGWDSGLSARIRSFSPGCSASE